MGSALAAIDSQVWAALLGVIVAFLLAEIAAIRRERGEDRKQRSSVRAALHYEIADDLAALKEFWPQIVQKGKDKKSADAVALRLMNTAVPVWSTVIWQGTASMIAVALDATEIRETQRFYATLAAISETQRRLEAASNSDVAHLAAQPETPAMMHGMPGHKFPTTDYFGNAAKTLVPALDKKVSAVLTAGNPIDPESFAEPRTLRSRLARLVTR